MSDSLDTRLQSPKFWKKGGPIIMPPHEDLVMIPFKGRDRSIVRIERLNQGNVNYKAAHYVADGPFKGIVINKAASDLRSVGRADLTLSFDVSMTDKKHNVNPEYKERRKVHFWFKPEADNTDLGREYMRQLLKPEGFPRDYVSFIKKALVLTQRFPLIQRIDIVLIPQYLGAPPGGRDGPDGFINGSLRSPTHEDWLKTTDEEQVARMRAQDNSRCQLDGGTIETMMLSSTEEAGSNPGCASLRPGEMRFSGLFPPGGSAADGGSLLIGQVVEDEENSLSGFYSGLGSAPPGSASLDPGQERRNQQAEEERKRREEQERLKKEEEERKRREEEQRKREEERRKREEEQRKRAAEERKRREEAEKRRREEAELMARKRREEQEQRERKKREEAEKRRKEEEELRRRAEEERQWREQQEQAKREAERKRREQEENKWKKRREEERLRREKEEEERLKRLKEEEERQRQLNAQAEEEEDEPIQNFITVMTPAVYDYQYLPEVSVNNKTDVAFRLKASANAHVALSSVYGDTERKTYEIVLGAQGNTKTMIRHGGEGPVMVEKVTRNLLDGDESRPFWISWANGKVVVGEGMEPGEDPFLVWDVPQNRIHSVNCMAVSTAPGSEGQWEFVEYIYPRRPETETRDAKRARFRTSLMWLAKKQKMLQVLEDAYPNSVNTPDLLRICNIGLNDMMTAVVILKEFVNRGLITEVVKGVWIRSPSGSPGDAHVIKVVDHLPVLKGRDIPSIAIVTSLYCEKLAVDAMMENKVSYVKYRTEEDGGKSRGESHVYTVGRIGSQMCVSTKLSRVGGSKGATIAAGNTVTRLLGIFDKVDHVIFVGVGGAVPDYHDYSRHVRLADVVVSCPSTKSTQQQHAGNDSGPVYYHCQKFGKGNNGKYEYETRPFEIKDETLQRYIDQLKRSSESGTYARPAPWERFIDEGLAALNAEESNFSKPSLKKDKLYAWVDDQMVQVEHPKPPKGKEYLYKEGQTHARYGPVASGKYLARNEKLRYDFARKHGVMAYDLDLDACLDAVTGSRKDSFIVIRGIADYADGSKSKEWQPYASLVAAAYMKALVTAMPTSYGRSGYYH